jgi:hypothetical protein
MIRKPLDLPPDVARAFVIKRFSPRRPIQSEQGNRRFAGERYMVSLKLKKNLAWFPQRHHSTRVEPPMIRSSHMRKIILTLAAVAAVGTAAVAPAEARGFGRGAAIGAGVGAAALGAAVAAGAYNNGYYGAGYGPGYGYGYAPDDGYYADPGYYDDGPRVYPRRYYNVPGN